MNVRAVLESHAAGQAAARAEAGDTGRLRAIVDAMRAATTIDAYNELDTEFHVELARASGNALLPVLMEALRGAMRRDMLRGFSALADWRAERDHLIGEHEAIVGRIEANDQDGAAQLLREHVLRFYSHVVEGSEEQQDEAPPSAA